MTEKWTSETTINFIHEFQSYECLWNTKSPNYKRKHMREASWKKVVEAMGMEKFDVLEAKKKMRNLRSTYYQEKSKICKSKASGAGSEDVYVPSLKWFSDMDSLLNADKERRKTINNIKSDYTSGEESNPGTSYIDVGATSPANETADLNVVFPGVPADCSNQKNKRNLNRKGIVQAISELKHLQELIKDDQSTFNHDTENQFDIFGRSVAAQLKSLPIQRALMAQSEIQKILSVQAITYYSDVSQM